MKTLILKDKDEDIREAGRILKEGGLVAFPTETVYGLGANGLNAQAVKKVYKAKGRPSDNPMILHISEIDDIKAIAEDVSEDALKLMKAFWPGPLTIVMKRKAVVPDETTGGLDTVGIRMPSDTVARKLIKEAGVPIAAPSANLSGKPSPTKAEHVIKDMDGRIDAVICGGDCQVGIESTVVSALAAVPVVLRPGKITKEQMSEVLGKEVIIDPAIVNEGVSKDFKPMAPGMKYRHYAPNAEMLVVEGKAESVKAEIEKRKKALQEQGKKVGVIVFDDEDFEKAAHDLFDNLRKMDDIGVDYIIAGAVKSQGLGYAVMNRMLKSAGYNVIKV